jgi:hypothetical protein
MAGTSVPMKLLALLLTLAAGNLIAAPRVWTSSDGRELTGSFVRADSSSVTVARENGKAVTIPLTQLTPEDQKFVTTQLAEQEAAKAAAAEAAKKPRGSITYKLAGGSEKWPEDRKKRIVDAMDQAIEFLNKHGDFRKEVTANNSPGTPTADANIGGWINWGGSISRRVAIHEIAHTLGIGTGEKWGENIEEGKWVGKYAIAQLQEFDGKDAVLHADRQHFWPYGLNQDSESNKENDLRHIKMVQAMRKDMGMR